MKSTLAISLVALVHTAFAATSGLVPVALRCESHDNPLGTDVATPALGWMIGQHDGAGAAPPRGAKQSAYQILAASKPELLAADQGDLWDSGMVDSDQSTHIVYAGKQLPPRQQVHWKVRIKDQSGSVSDWSRSATWIMGVMGDWKSPWIAARDVPMNRPMGQRLTPVPDLKGRFSDNPPVTESPQQTAPLQRRREAVFQRRDVKLDAKPVSAVARVSAMGFVDFSVNGKKAGDHVTAPAISDYTKRVFYHVHDVTAHFRAGTNTLGGVLGNGYFAAPSRGWKSWVGVGNEPAFSVEVELTMPDGSKRFLTSDTSWKWSTAEITFNDFFMGEHQDLRLAKTAWDSPGFNDGSWHPVVQVAAPPGVMQANPGVPQRVTKEVKPVRVEGNRYIFEHMQTGWPVVRASGAAGTEVMVGDHGKSRGNMKGASGSSADLQYILKGLGQETLEPRFMVHSIGPVISVDGIDPPPIDAVSIKSAHADLRHTGSFSCSNPFLNHVHDATLRTHLNYTLDIPMDPTREKSGWTQDVQTMIDSTVYLTDMAALYRRWWTDMQESQLADGSVGSVAPMIWGGQENIWNDPWWGGMIIYLPYKHYLYYGDKGFLEAAYDTMARYLKWLDSKADPNDGLLRWAGASDWIEVGIKGWGPPKRTPTYLVSTCAHYRFTTMMEEISRILGKPGEADAYAAAASKIKGNFNTRLFDPATGLYAGAKDSQTSLILPLAFGMVPEDKKPLVIKRLAENINHRGNHLSTGFVGTPYLIATMTDLGLGDLLYGIITQQDHPGWNTLISDGVMKETWEGGLVQMPSLGGSIGQWFYKVAGGIRPDPAAPGFKKIIIRPAIVGDLSWLRCTYESIHGQIVSNWRRDGKTLAMEVKIPPNTTAEIHVPAKPGTTITESGKPAATSQGVKFLRQETGATIFEVLSGTYQFTATTP